MTLVNADTGEVVGRSLSECEAVIQRGLATFVEVGEALAEIRDLRLYRATHGDFDTYCRERWGMKRAHAYRLIDSADIVGQLSPMGDSPAPQSERQARALAPLRHDPPAMAEVMDEVTAEAEAEQARVTAERIAEKVAQKLNAAHAVAEEARQSVEDFKALQPDDFDPVLNRELIRQRGELSRLCRDLVAIGDPTEFVARHDGHLRDEHRDRVRDAARWIARLAETMEVSP